MYSIFRICRIIAWTIWSQCLIFFHKILMSKCAQVSKFGSTVSCKQIKFRQKNHSKWKMLMLNFEQKVSTDAEDSQVCLWYCFVYHLLLFFLRWSCELGANIDCTIKLKWHFNYTHLSSTSKTWKYYYYYNYCQIMFEILIHNTSKCDLLRRMFISGLFVLLNLDNCCRTTIGKN